jgi:hypothetical protein
MAQPRKAMIHTRIELELVTERGERERMTVQLADSRNANLDEGWIDIEAPLGRAIRGQPEGARIPYVMGDIRSVRIVSVAPVDELPSSDAEARRQEILERARRKSERATQEIFSSSYGSKWGGYAAEDLASDEEEKDIPA